MSERVQLNVQATVTDEGVTYTPCDEEPERWNTHNNNLGDYCTWSGTTVGAPNTISGADDGRCPQGCRASFATTDPND